ncbi:hypothetical protein D3C73_1282500 [compost metagenome]
MNRDNSFTWPLPESPAAPVLSLLPALSPCAALSDLLPWFPFPPPLPQADRSEIIMMAANTAASIL